MFPFGDCNGCNTEIHEKDYWELHQIIHNIETGDLIFSNALGSKAFWIQFGTRSRFTHIAMAIRLGELSTDPEIDNITVNDGHNDTTKSFCHDRRTVSDAYHDFTNSLKAKRRRYPKICPRDCLNTVCLWESTNYTDNYDIWKGFSTSGCHLVLLFDKCNNQGYKYFGIRKLFALYHHSPKFSTKTTTTTIQLSLNEKNESQSRRQIPHEYLSRIWEFILITYSKPYDGSLKSIMMSVHKSFSNPSLVYKNYRNSFPSSIIHSTISNDTHTNHSNTDFYGDRTISSQRKSSLDLLRDTYSKKEHFFCSALIAATLRFCGILASGHSNEKVNDNDWSPDDFTDDDMLELIRSFEYSEMKYFNGINIVLLLEAEVISATPQPGETTRIEYQKRKHTLKESPEPNSVPTSTIMVKTKKRKRKRTLPVKFQPFVSLRCPSLSMLDQMET